MPLKFAWQRVKHHRTQLAALLVIFCALTGFLSLLPYLVDGVLDAHLRYNLQDLASRDLRISLANDAPIPQETRELADGTLGALLGKIERLSRTVNITCGFRYEAGAEIATAFPTTRSGCYQISAYPDAEIGSYFAVAEGRLPQILPVPDTPRSIMGEPHAEAVITSTTSRLGDVSVGDFIVFGTVPNQTITIEVVGLVDPYEPEDLFFRSQTILMEGVLTVVGDDLRYDLGLLVLPEVYESLVADVSPNGNVYSWYLEVDAAQFEAASLPAQEEDLRAFDREMAQLAPGVTVSNTVVSLVDRIRREVGEVENLILALAASFTALMAAHLLFAALHIVDRQGAEWALLLRRGASLTSLHRTLLETLAVVALLSVIAGPVIGIGLFVVLDNFGPAAVALDGTNFDLLAALGRALLLSVIGATLGLVVLHFALFVALRKLHQKAGASVVPRPPFFVRYSLDAGLIVVGVALWLRTFFLRGGDLRENVQNFFQNPGALARQTSGPTDPYDLLGPAALMVGVTFLAVRFPPFAARLLERMLARYRGLAPHLVLWEISRAPARNAVMLALLVMTTAVGVTAFALDRTHDAGTWALARQQTGGDIQLVLEPQAQPEIAAWDLDEEVAALSPIVREVDRTNQRDNLLGLDIGRFAALYPEYARALAPLADAPDLERRGQLLPEDADTLTLMLYSTEADEAIEVNLVMDLESALGVRRSVPFITSDPTASGKFVEYRAEIPETNLLPWRIVALAVVSKRENPELFEHVIYIDDVRVTLKDGQAVTLMDFEPPATPLWNEPQALAREARAVIVQSRASSGEWSLRLDYNIRSSFASGPPRQIEVAAVTPQPVPLLMSENWAAQIGRTANASGRPLKAGDRGALEMNLSQGNMVLDYVVVGVVGDFPGQAADANFVIAEAGDLMPVINGQVRTSGYYGWNEVLVRLRGDVPSERLRDVFATSGGISGANFAADAVADMDQEPLANVVIALLNAGFWLTLGVSLFTVALDARYALLGHQGMVRVLGTLGWSDSDARNWLISRYLLPLPLAMIYAVGVGAALAYLLHPVLSLIRGETLRLPGREFVLVVAGVTFVLALVLSGRYAVLSYEQILHDKMEQ